MLVAYDVMSLEYASVLGSKLNGAVLCTSREDIRFCGDGVLLVAQSNGMLISIKSRLSRG